MRVFAVLFAGSLLVGCRSADSSSGFPFDPLAANGTSGMAGGPALLPAAASSPQQMVDPSGSPILHVGDRVTVSFQDLVSSITPVEAMIKEDGTISLIYNKQFAAAGKSVGELEQDIRKVYVPNYFVNMTPIVSIMDRFYSVGGEVKSPGRQAYVGRMTVLKAIDTAGGFTDFANKKNVKVTRSNGKQETVNAKKALEDPALDKPVFPGDQVFVKRRIL